MGILKYLDKNNLHHAYLIEGERNEILPEIFKFLEDLGVKTSNNPDFYNITIDSFKIEDARNLKSVQYEKSFSGGKKIFLISVNNFLLEAQNTLLKIFEEPKEDTHFFIIIPNKNILLKTLISRFYLISSNQDMSDDQLILAEKFILMPVKERLFFMKGFLSEEEDSEENLIIQPLSNRAKSLNFLNALEVSLYKRKNQILLNDFFPHLLKVREFVNQPGSSLKSLMESIALAIPNF
ncbi:MAG: polymerase III, delta' subunit family protein [Candidatus Nomurabacteria bacterium GW2011_GWE1_32_28]|uniref:Polymerase III, delta' subunit family protein n=1 Tax=Candidatus Nomurabacteria bacterium GW2011_GWF1_31_48 TaxID=1618767 RepID=A0A0F9YVS7_9BACT|nr:MAG: polymerase III, delta' subunit family protein [Candidatus Nomurabacteria bacterium GW2011_GWF2_30_133]KKP29029.1 MAG: polymerase III, delta' subunit family protein [Candidatus Nomurabacteria bacterium GW2011_GWE2_31_40]KKP30561.1 MAG: polymerase III, delta' subunit family protein [Candidatus Nomurabacteria bacterium GW2011_GWF1_31_48]KKP35046.1 MAG: polymerase III, delta' subunit family protein [Candidatus Nomurabacteria bacterium GW2011_GWE1_32_28]HAS80589.1 hypothetical protein [Candi